MQTKKPAIRANILRTAARLFRARGYAGTSLARIARGAAISTTNIYVYFDGKLDILFALAGPWLLDRLAALEAELEGIEDGRLRLRTLLVAMWSDIPGDPRGYAGLLMEGLATLGPADRYSRTLLLSAETRIAALLARCMPEAMAEGQAAGALAHLTMMAFDGFAVNRRLGSETRPAMEVIDAFCALVQQRPPGEPAATAPVGHSVAVASRLVGR